MTVTPEYLPPLAFDQRYPDEVAIGSGTFGTVYKSGSHAIKVIAGDGLNVIIQQGVKELNLYSRIRHPCIPTLNHWTIDLHTETPMFKLALPLGIDLFAAVAEGLTFEQVAIDLLSAVSILHQAGFAHNDIKTANCIYYQGHVQLIDFGLATPLFFFTNETVIDNPLYTVTFRDPEITAEEAISAKVELYAIGAILYDLFQDHTGLLSGYPISNYGQTVSAKKNNKLTPSQTALLFDLTRFPLSRRLTLPELIQNHPWLHIIPGALIETPVPPLPADCNRFYLVNTMYWLLEVSQDQDIELSTYFLALHLLRRCLPLIIPEYATNQWHRSRLQLVGEICLMVAQVVNESEVTFDLYTVIDMSDQIYLLSDAKAMLLNVLQACKGIISTPTPWTQADNAEELPDGLLDLTRCHYDPDYRLRHVGQTSKDISPETFDQLLNTAFPGQDPLNNRLLYTDLNRPGLRTRATNVPISRHFKPEAHILSYPNLVHLLSASKSDHEANFRLKNSIFVYFTQILTYERDHNDKYDTILKLLQRTPVGRRVLEYFWLPLEK